MGDGDGTGTGTVDVLDVEPVAVVSVTRAWNGSRPPNTNPPTC